MLYSFFFAFVLIFLQELTIETAEMYMTDCITHWTLFQKCTTFLKLITIICMSVAHQSTAHYRPVPYRDVLKSRVVAIRSGINQFYDIRNHGFVCDHYPIYLADLPNVVFFLWASDRETHGMRSCIYQELKRKGEDIIVSLFTTYMYRKTLVLDLTTFCNRTIRASKPIYQFVGDTLLRTVGLINFIVSDPKNDGILLEENGIQYGTPTVSSWIRIRPLDGIGNHVRTFVCSSVQMTLNKAGKLRQRFFSVVGNSTDVIVKATRNGSAGLSLDFDVLTLNASRRGLLNGSRIELLSLSDMQVACVKRDQYGLNVETNKIVDIDTTKELSVETETQITQDKLRLRVHVSVPVVSDQFWRIRLSNILQASNKKQ